MKKVALHVEGMSCVHCERAVKAAAGGLSGVSDVVVDLAGKTVTVAYEGTPLGDIIAAIEEEGYHVHTG